MLSFQGAPRSLRISQMSRQKARALCNVAPPLCTQSVPHPHPQKARKNPVWQGDRVGGVRGNPNPRPLRSPCVSPGSAAMTHWLYQGLHPLWRFQTHIVLKTHPVHEEKLKFPQLGAEVGAPRDGRTLRPQPPAQGRPEPSTDHPQGSLWAPTSHVISELPPPPLPDQSFKARALLRAATHHCWQFQKCTDAVPPPHLSAWFLLANKVLGTRSNLFRVYQKNLRQDRLSTH